MIPKDDGVTDLELQMLDRGLDVLRDRLRKRDEAVNPTVEMPLREFTEMLRTNIDLFERHWIAEHVKFNNNCGVGSLGAWIYHFHKFLESPDEYRNKHHR